MRKESASPPEVLPSMNVRGFFFLLTFAQMRQCHSFFFFSESLAGSAGTYAAGASTSDPFPGVPGSGGGGGGVDCGPSKVVTLRRRRRPRERHSAAASGSKQKLGGQPAGADRRSTAAAGEDRLVLVHPTSAAPTASAGRSNTSQARYFSLNDCTMLMLIFLLSIIDSRRTSLPARSPPARPLSIAGSPLHPAPPPPPGGPQRPRVHSGGGEAAAGGPQTPPPLPPSPSPGRRPPKRSRTAPLAVSASSAFLVQTQTEGRRKKGISFLFPLSCC